MNTIESNRVIRRREVTNITGLSKASIYLKMKEGSFPKPIKISSRAVAWPEKDIFAWLREKVDARDAQATGGAKYGQF